MMANSRQVMPLSKGVLRLLKGVLKKGNLAVVVWGLLLIAFCISHPFGRPNVPRKAEKAKQMASHVVANANGNSLNAK